MHCIWITCILLTNFKWLKSVYHFFYAWMLCQVIHFAPPPPSCSVSRKVRVVRAWRCGWPVFWVALPWSPSWTSLSRMLHLMYVWQALTAVHPGYHWPYILVPGATYSTREFLSSITQWQSCHSDIFIALMCINNILSLSCTLCKYLHVCSV